MCVYKDSQVQVHQISIWCARSHLRLQMYLFLRRIERSRERILVELVNWPRITSCYRSIVVARNPPACSSYTLMRTIGALQVICNVCNFPWILYQNYINIRQLLAMRTRM